MDKGLLIFVKNPEKGKVKTRLAATVGDDKALRIYKELLRHTREVALAVNAKRYLFYSQQIQINDDWAKADFEKRLQVNGDLGVKMTAAFQEVLREQSGAIIIGSDCASLTSELVNEACEALNSYDFVIGPAMDGGYYLLGMNTFETRLFEDIEWSTESVCARTLKRINALGKQVYILPTLSDIDYEEDWQKYGWELED